MSTISSTAKLPFKGRSNVPAGRTLLLAAYGGSRTPVGIHVEKRCSAMRWQWLGSLVPRLPSFFGGYAKVAAEKTGKTGDEANG